MQANQLQQIVNQRTNFQIQNLHVECGPERVVLRGDAGSYYAKQLAQEGIREFLPRVLLKNAIVVRPRVDQFISAEAS